MGQEHQSRVVARLRAAGLQGREKGFALPLALGVSLVLGLSSLSMQTATLQARARLGSTLRLRHAEDALMSAAQHLIGQLNRRHGCLLELPLADWSTQGMACADSAEQGALREGSVLEMPYRLVEWKPDHAPGGEVHRAELLLELGEAGSRRPQRAAYAVELVELAGTSLRAMDPRELGLRGVRP